MKKIIFSAAISMLAFSCNNPATTATGNNQSQVEKNLANNRKVYTAIETGDVTPIDSIIATDAVDHDGPMGTDVKGKDSILHMLGDIHNHVKNIKLDVISSAAEGDYIFTLVHVTGKIDSANGMSGRDLDEKGVDVIKINSDNKMVDHWGFTEDQQVSKEMMEMQNKMGGKDPTKMKK